MRVCTVGGGRDELVVATDAMLAADVELREEQEARCGGTVYWKMRRMRRHVSNGKGEREAKGSSRRRRLQVVVVVVVCGGRGWRVLEANAQTMHSAGPRADD